MTERRKKRPKSVFKKMWETRRRNKALQVVAENPPTTAMIGADPNASRTLQSLQNQQPSPVDAIARTLDMHRDEQLCCFLAEMSTMRRTGALQGHFPIMLSRSQAEAIEGWLTEHGYSAFGKGSGSLMSVSTNPCTNPGPQNTITKAA